MRIVMVGAGYVGLVSAACFAEFGHDVICVDIDRRKIDLLNAGRLPIFEPGLEEVVSGNVRARRLRFSSDLHDSVANADAVFIAVGTPSRRLDGEADLHYVYLAARDIAQALKPGALVVMKSTVPVGTGDEIERIIGTIRPELDFEVGSNPEFLRAGAAIQDFKHPDRIVIGAESEAACEKLKEIYRPLFLNAAPIL